MCESNDDYSYPDDQSEEDETYDDECIIFNYDDFLKYQNKSPLWSPTDESQDEDCDSNESNSRRQDDYYQQYYIPGSESKSAARGKHSCLKLEDGYCYLDPSVYDTRVMRNLSTMDDHLPCSSYSPKFIQAALEKTESSSSWSDDGQVDNYVDYNNEETQCLDEYYYDYPLPTQPPKPISQAGEYSGLTAIVENLIYDTEVLIFSKTYCPYCVTVKDIFDEMDQPYTVLELDQRADGDRIQRVMQQITGGTSVPRVFVNGIFIGGGDDVKRLYESDKESCFHCYGSGYKDLDCDGDNAYLAKIGKVIYHMYEPNDAFSDVSDATIIFKALKKLSVFPTPSTDDIPKIISGCQPAPCSLKHSGVSNAATGMGLQKQYIMLKSSSKSEAPSKHRRSTLSDVLAPPKAPSSGRVIPSIPESIQKFQNRKHGTMVRGTKF